MRGIWAVKRIVVLLGLFVGLHWAVSATGASAQNANSSELRATLPALELGEDIYWDAVKDSKNPEAFRQFLQKFPDGKFRDLARLRLLALSPPSPPSSAPRNDTRASMSDEKPEKGFTAWLSADAYQALFDRTIKDLKYPQVVEARNVGGERQFRARFVPNPPGYFYFYTHSGISEEAFNRRDGELRAQGYRLTYRHNLDDEHGRSVQAVWIRTR